jgi:hypothetical protein
MQRWGCAIYWETTGHLHEVLFNHTSHAGDRLRLVPGWLRSGAPPVLDPHGTIALTERNLLLAAAGLMLIRHRAGSFRSRSARATWYFRS